MNSRISITFNQYPCVAGLFAGWCMSQRLLSTEIWFWRSVNSNKNSIFFSHRRTRLIEPPRTPDSPESTPKSFPACYENIFLVFDSFAGLCDDEPIRRKFDFFIVRRCVCQNRQERKANVCCCFSGGTETKADDSRENNDMQKYRIKNQFIVESFCCRHTLSGPTFHFYSLSRPKGLGRTDPRKGWIFILNGFLFFSFVFICTVYDIVHSSGLLSKLIYGHEFN